MSDPVLPAAVLRLRPRQERAIVTRDRIVDAAIAIIEREGEAAVTVSQLVADTGLSRGAIYHHFADRSEVVRAAQFGRLARQPSGDIAALRAAIRDARDQNEFVETVGLITAALCEPARIPVRLVRATAIVAAATHDDARVPVVALESDVAADLAGVVREGQARGFIVPHVDAGAIAVVIEAVAFGLLIATCIEPLPRRVDLAAAVRQAFLGFLTGREETDTVSVL